MATQTVGDLLESLGVPIEDFADCESIDEEFSVIKRSYFKKVLKLHPDKGGDVVQFRAVQSAFEVLRDMYDTGSVGESFVSCASASTTDAYGDAHANTENKPTPSWEFYSEAAEESVPAYSVEPAKSGRSMCRQKGKKAKK